MNRLAYKGIVMSFAITRHFRINNNHPRKILDNLVALHLFKELLFRTSVIPLRF